MVRGGSPADTQGRRGMSNSERGPVGEQGDGEASEGGRHTRDTAPVGNPSTNEGFYCDSTLGGTWVRLEKASRAS